MALLHELFNQNKVEDSFDTSLEGTVWGTDFGAYDYASEVKKILIHRPGREVQDLKQAKYDPSVDALVLKDDAGHTLSYCSGHALPDFELMREQHDHLRQTLSDQEIDIFDYTSDPIDWSNRLFTRDSALITPHGAILCRMSSYFRQGEVRIIQKTLTDLNIPIVGAIQGRGFIEGGSFSIINGDTAIIGRSVRNNDEGIAQLRHLLELQGIELHVLDVPANKIHVDELFLLLSHDKALVDTRIIPHWFLEFLIGKGIEPIPVDPDDPPLTNNCLAIAPGKVVFPAAGTRTRAELEKRGLDVLPVDVSELNKMGGGIHCLTLPLYRVHN